MLQRVGRRRRRRTVAFFSLSEVSGNSDVWSPVSQEKENLGALERKYGDLTGGRSFTLREVGFSSGRPLSLRAPQDSEGGDGCGTFLNKKKNGRAFPLFRFNQEASSLADVCRSSSGRRRDAAPPPPPHSVGLCSLSSFFSSVLLKKAEVAFHPAAPAASSCSRLHVVTFTTALLTLCSCSDLSLFFINQASSVQY